jgi:hypothetical protein
MDDVQRSWYEIKFQLVFRFADGTAFQNFFSEVMELRYPGDFQRVKPYGRLGDRKCDGYHSSIKVVCQVYAPETLKLDVILAKIDEDFLGALDYWKDQMLGWRFVHNQWRGLPADVVSKLTGLETKHKIEVSHWGEPEIRGEVFQLSGVDIGVVLGNAPTRANVSELGFEDLRIVLETISQQPSSGEEEVRPVPQDKLVANALSNSVERMLLIGMQKSALVQRFFSTWHDPQFGDRVARAFRTKYEELKASNVHGDDAFLELWRFAGGAERKAPRIEAAVLAVLAFLFEECEIFDPLGEKAL